MQMRCSYCQTMFAISHEETLAAIEHMADNNLKYYDAHCPNCRRANRVERFKLEASYPGWQAAIKTMTKEADKAQPEEKAPAAKKTTLAKEPTKKKSTAKETPVKKPAGTTSTSKGKKK
jgi:hypothetical protein